MANGYTDTITYTDLKGKDVQVKVRARADFVDVCAMIEFVVSRVIDQNGKYTPYMESLAYHDGLLRTYTNMKQKDLNTIARLVDETALFDQLHDVIDADQAKFIKAQIQDMVSYRKEKAGLHSLCMMIGDSTSALNQVFQTMAQSPDAVNQMSEMIDRLKEMRDESTFSLPEPDTGKKPPEGNDNDE